GIKAQEKRRREHRDTGHSNPSFIKQRVPAAQVSGNLQAAPPDNRNMGRLRSSFKIERRP
ncbi:MAG: hypothetical protein ABIY37_03920, partial [Devosia sp.]